MKTNSSYTKYHKRYFENNKKKCFERMADWKRKHATQYKKYQKMYNGLQRSKKLVIDEKNEKKTFLKNP